MFDLFESEFDHVFSHSSLDSFRDDDGYHYTSGENHVHAQDNIFGGHDFYENGVYAGHSEANIFGGQDYYDEHHIHTGHTESNGIGGMHVYGNEGFEGTFVHNDVGHDMFMSDMGDYTHFSGTEVGNASHIMDYDDPLDHIDSYIMPDMILL